MIFDNAVFIKPDIKFNREMTYENNAPMFRKKFYTGNTKDAKLFVCGLGYAYYYINGKKVKVKGANRVVWDITPKPPATSEWE